MPRTRRDKSCDSIYHIMVRSISDTPLFKDDRDKEKYLELIKKYQDIHLFKVYAYCLMDTHGHIIIDAAGADISEIMHGINQSYAQYYNRRYNRRGHLFQDRFKSKIVKDERYLITLSGYIHNNASDIFEFKNKIHKYKYSSMGIYLGIRSDNHGIVDASFIMQLFSIHMKKARGNYLNFTRGCNEESIKGELEFVESECEYRSERKIVYRNIEPENIIEFVSEYVGQGKGNIKVKSSKDFREFKALAVLLMRGLCDMNQRMICEMLGNITQGHVSRLCLEGARLIRERNEYKNIVGDFLKSKGA